MELNASVPMINRQIQYSFSLNIGWSWREEWPDSTRPETAEAARSLRLIGGAKQSVTSAGRESQTVTAFHERMQTSGIHVRIYFGTPVLALLILRDPIWCESRRGGWLDWFKTPSGGV